MPETTSSTLGEELNLHGAKPADWPKGVVVLGLIVAACVGALSAMNPPPPDAAYVPPAIIGACLLVALIGVVFWVRHSRVRVALHANGVAVLRGASRSECAWDDAVAVRTAHLKIIRRGIHHDTRHRAWIRRRDGSELAVPDVVEGEDLVAQIERHVVERVAPSLAGQFASGRPVAFGPYSAEPDGLRHGGDLVLWRDLSRVEIDAGSLVVRRRNVAQPVASVPVGNLENLPVLLGLIARHAPDALPGRAA